MSKKLNELKKAFVDRFLHMSLRTKQLMVTLLGLAALVLFAMVLGNAVYRSVRSRGLSNFRMSADSAADSIETETDMIYRNAVVILRNADVRTLLQEELTEEEMLRIISIKNQAVSFIRILEEISYIDSTEIYLAEEREFLADHDLFRSFREAENDERFRGFVSGSAKGMWAVGGEDFCYYTRVVRLDDYRRTAAVIRIGYSAEHLKQLLQPTLITHDCFSALLSPDGEILMTAGDGEQAEKLLKGEESFPTDTLSYSKSGKCHVYVRELENTGWQLLSCVPDRSFRRMEAFGDYIPVFLVIILTWAGILIATTVYSANLVKKIRVISRYVQSVPNKHEIGQIEPFKAQDEMQELADSCNRMAEELKNNLQREYLLGLSKRNSDLRALQAQINPHFLYNTLELIDYYAYENQPDVVEKIVKSLADFYKLSLNNGSDLYSLWKEIHLIEAYFDIQKIRWENIELQIDIPDELAQCQIPPFTLQPLVENSILHGIRANPEHRGEVFVSARREGDDVIVMVRDDGAGMSEQLSKELNREMELISEDTVSGSHYGIQNSNQRLKIVFGEAYGMQIESVEHAGTVVRIRIPAS